MRDVVIGVDGGNSKTDVAVADRSGAVLAVVRGAGSSPDKLGVAGALDVIEVLVDQALGDPAVPRDARPVALATLLAGLDLPEQTAAFSRALRARHGDLELMVGNDTVAVLLAGTAGGPGVAVVCGAGINAAGRSPTGARSAFLSLGQLSGDWGGGMSLGREMLWWAIRDEDGRGEPTALRPAVRAHFGVPSVTDLVLAIHRGEVAATRLAELVPALFEADSGADAAARAMVDRLAREVAGMARVMLDRSDLLGVRVPVVLAGGVLTSGYERLRAMVTDHLFGQAPLATPELLGCRPVAGALVAALSVLPQAHPGDVAQVARRITVAPDLTSRS